jgi:hypothetical protein
LALKYYPPSVIFMQPHSIGKVFKSKEGRYILISFRTVLLTVQCTPQSRQIAKLFLRSSELGLSRPLSRRQVHPPPPLVQGGGHTRERGVGESQFQRGDIHCGTLYILSTLWCTLSSDERRHSVKKFRPPSWQLKSDGIFAFNFVTFRYWMSLISSPPLETPETSIVHQF